jgi:protein SCO1/2
MKKKYLWYAGFFLVLVGAFYFLLFAGTDYYKVKLPVLTYVKEFSFTDQNGKPVTDRNVEGKVYVAEYFFTTCKGICPKMNNNMRKIYDQYKKEDGFAILSHTCMPETDSVPVLKAYEKRMIGTTDTMEQLSTVNGQRTLGNWYFLTGSKDALYRMARESYLLDDKKNNSANIADQFIHTQFFALVDKQKRVRGIYDALKEDEIKKLTTDIGELLKETIDRRSGFNSPFTNNPG